MRLRHWDKQRHWDTTVDNSVSTTSLPFNAAESTDVGGSFTVAAASLPADVAGSRRRADPKLASRCRCARSCSAGCVSTTGSSSGTADAIAARASVEVC
eukprot:3764189-Prymnesium_polylepis.2